MGMFILIINKLIHQLSSTTVIIDLLFKLFSTQKQTNKNAEAYFLCLDCLEIEFLFTLDKTCTLKMTAWALGSFDCCFLTSSIPNDSMGIHFSD